ncbi:unnamed protein product [Clonostachys solani]|uniref:tRNA pseudouridine(55) synthase n=1 Tax=Clonostachys solani TaxID=160281 RepID=A0A9N9ZBP9_9HYPO|nr:unnamed protein product [Clonostachys solani]
MASDVIREGCLAINKPCGMSSAQVIRECQVVFSPSAVFKPLLGSELDRARNVKGYATGKRLKRQKPLVKMGHGGTLDPLATGVLILGIGSGTKALPQFLNCVKTYETTVLFGASTDTYDRVGRIINKRPYEHITKEKVLKAMEAFKGKQKQVPPLFSALKMNGKPLYEYAREGKPIPREIEAREVEVSELELVEWYEPGKHNHRWPTEEAEAAERNIAEQVWRLKKQQESSQNLTPEEKEEDNQALEAHESFKRKFEERQDTLIKDQPPKKRNRHEKNPAMMSGALGKLPRGLSDKGRDLIPAAPDASTPPPWSDEGPPAAKIRMTVSSGYYVRSFCHDLGAELDSAGLMAELCRLRQSDFTVGGTTCLEFDDMAKGEEVWGPKVSDMLDRWNAEPGSQWQPPSKEKKMRPSRPSHGDQEDVSNTEEKPVEPENKPSHRPSPTEQKPKSPEGASSPRKAVNGGRRERSDDEKSWNGIED